MEVGNEASATFYKVQGNDARSHQRQWVAQQDEAGRVVRQIFPDLLETLVYSLVFILANLVVMLVDEVYTSGVPVAVVVSKGCFLGQKLSPSLLPAVRRRTYI